MKRYIFIISMLIPLFLQAQPLLKELPNYPFIDYQKNVLQFPGGRAQQDLFYNKLDSLLLFANKSVQIIHIGGSHVQADVFSNRMRMNLTQMLPGLSSERGVIFPFRVAKTNNPHNYVVSYNGSWEKNVNSKFNNLMPLGVTGMAVKTGDPGASISIKLNRHEEEFWKFDMFRLIGESEEDCIVPLAIVHGDTIYPLREKETHSYIYSCSETDSIRLIFPQTGDEIGTFTVSGMLPENQRKGIVYHALGVNGASVAAWLLCINFEQELQNIVPDLVIMAIGINDANVPYGKFNSETFKSNYRQLINSIKRVSPNCAFLFITNNDAYYRVGRNNRIPNKNGKLVQQAFFELAKEQGAGIWDLYDIMGGLGSMQRWQNNGLANSDKIHFKQPGYLLLGDMLYNALISDYLYRY